MFSRISKGPVSGAEISKSGYGKLVLSGWEKRSFGIQDIIEGFQTLSYWSIVLDSDIKYYFPSIYIISSWYLFYFELNYLKSSSYSTRIIHHTRVTELQNIENYSILVYGHFKPFSLFLIYARILYTIFLCSCTENYLLVKRVN